MIILTLLFIHGDHNYELYFIQLAYTYNTILEVPHKILVHQNCSIQAYQQIKEDIVNSQSDNTMKLKQIKSIKHREIKKNQCFCI